MDYQVPYKVLNPGEFGQDYGSSRRYAPILRRISLELHSDRHNLLFTDDTRKSGDIVTSYALHVDSLRSGELDQLERAVIGLSLSSEEVANSSQLYVNPETGKTENQSEYGNGDGVNQKRFDPRIFTEVVKFDFGSPSYKEWARGIWKEAGYNYENVDEDKRDIWLFTEWDIAPTLLRYFEADQNRILFINEVQPPETEKEKQILLKGLQNGLYREESYGSDHRDYVQRIPNAVWTVPFDLCAEFEDQYNSSSRIMPYEYPNRNFLLNRPFNEWLKGLSEKFRTVDEKRRCKSLMTMTEYIEGRLEDVLGSISRGVKRIRQEKNLRDQDLLEFLGLTQEELIYLEQFKERSR